MRPFLKLVAVVAFALPLAGLALPALAEDMDRDQTRDMDRTHDMTHDQDRDRDADRLMDRLRTELKLSDREVDGLKAQVRTHLRNGGDADQVRTMLRTAVGEGCREDCLQATVRTMNRFMAQGKSASQAREMVATELHAAAREGDAAGLTQRFEARVEARAMEASKERKTHGVDPDMPGMDRDMRGMDHGPRGR
jgi:uncharacterized protein YoaH (UPF0181 family)